MVMAIFHFLKKKIVNKNIKEANNNNLCGMLLGETINLRMSLLESVQLVIFHWILCEK